MAQLPSILEALMVISFGLSWPGSLLKAYKARTAKGKSLFFLSMICFGYVCGIVSKLLSGNITYVLFFYFLNLFMVSCEIVIYFRNTKLDREERR